MSDYQNGSDAVDTDAQAEVEAKHPFYDTPEPRPTEQVENEEIVAESDDEAEDEGAESPPDANAETDEEVEVFDQPDDFAKYEFDSESGLYEFKSQGKKVKVNPAQLIKSWREDQKLHSELQKIADERKGLWDEAKQKELVTYQEQAKSYQEAVESLRELVSGSEKSEQDWEELRETDIAEYTRQKELEQKRKDALAKADSDRLQAEQAQRQAHIDIEAKKLREFVGDTWNDQKVMTEELSGMQEVAASFDLSPEDMVKITDHRFWRAMREIMQFRKVKESASKVKPITKTPKTTKAQRSTPKDEPKSTAELFYGSK